MKYTEEQLEKFAYDYFCKVDHMPSDQWDRLPLRVKQEHLEKMRVILAIMPEQYMGPKEPKFPKFKVGDKVRIVRLVDTITSQSIIGQVGTITEVDDLPNGDYNYRMDSYYVHEEELELSPAKAIIDRMKGGD